MKLQIFIESEDGGILIDKSYQVLDNTAPEIDLQQLVDTALDKEQEIIDYAKMITQSND